MGQHVLDAALESIPFRLSSTFQSKSLSEMSPSYPQNTSIRCMVSESKPAQRAQARFQGLKSTKTGQKFQKHASIAYEMTTICKATIAASTLERARKALHAFL